MKIFLTGPEGPESLGICLALTAAGHEVVVRPPQAITLSVLESTTEPERLALIELLVKAHARKHPLLLSVQGQPKLAMAGS